MVAIVQRPGELVADTKVNLYLDPGRFLGDVLSLWSPTVDLGHVWAGQYAGYAWPMAPWFWLGDELGIPTWLVHRLWLGTLLALAGWGVVRLLDALLGPERRRGAMHLAAAVLFVVNPYVATYFARQSIALLAYASLPWLLLCVQRGLREPRGWRWPIAFALVLSSAGGGVNAGLTGWVLLGPLLLVLYGLWLRDVAWSDVRSFLVRLVPVAVVANLWWVVPLGLASRAAPDFLAFTEQPGTIWGTTSLSESMRLLGFWGTYVGTGFGGALRPYQGTGPVLLLALPVVLAGLVTPALSLSAFVVTKRWRYAPFFLVLTLAGLVVMTAGWPEGTPMRHLVTGVYYHVSLVQFLRTTYKAGALTALGLAGLGGAAFGYAWARWRGVAVRGGIAGAAVALLVVSCWPLVTGRAVEGQLRFKVPPAYDKLAADLDRRPDATRAAVFPGQLFAFYKWGGTVDPVLPALTKHMVSERWIIPFADRRSSDLQFGVDALVTQERLTPGQLPPLLSLMGVGDVVLAADGDRAYSGEMPAADAVRALSGLGKAVPYGRTVTARGDAGSLGGDARVPQLQRIPLRGNSTVQVLPRGSEQVVDGAADGIESMASFGALDPLRALAYGPDLGAAGIRSAERSGASFVVADGNRRRAFVAARSRGQTGPTLTAGNDISQDGTILDPFGAASEPGAAARETVAVYGGGITDVTAPASPQVTQLPDQRPFAALDGDTTTAWIADRHLVPVRPDLTVTLDRPRDIQTIDLMPYGDSRGRVRAVTVNGRRFPVKSGWNRLSVNLRGARSVVVHLADVTRPRHGNAGAGGIRELWIPGIRATESLRPPTDVEDALRGTDIQHNAFSYILNRTTADVPYARGRYTGERGAGELRDATDPEAQLRRIVTPPAARNYKVSAWATVDPRTADSELDRLTGTPDLIHADSSSRFENRGRYRASGAFDAGGGRDWIGQWIPGRPAWVAWTAGRTETVRSFALVPARAVVREPTKVALSAGGRRVVANVGSGGFVKLPRAVTGRRFRLDVLAAKFPAGTPARDRQRRAVGIGTISGVGPSVLGPEHARSRGTVALPCGIASVRVGARDVPLGGRVDRAALDAGRPLRLRGCGGGVAIPARATTITGVAGTPLRVDALRLTSAAPAPRGGASFQQISVVSDRTHARISESGPAWLVLGQSYDKHWKATCDGRDLGAPVPMQGYANAWPIRDASCRVVFTYGLQRAANVASIVSLVACLLLLVLLLAAAWIARKRVSTFAVADLPLPEVPQPRPLGRAILLALVPAIVVAGGFGLRAGVVAGPVLVLILWRGLPDVLLGRIAAALLIVGVPIAYVVVQITQHEHHLSGNDTKYPLDRIAGHWMTLAGLLLLSVIAWRQLAAARRRDRVASGS
ncbi:alpha-(1-_3)-arabinofuranosyltransferase domain-containing protein [Conexibacter woesei]|uniref:alpha-(1->3)-arabinofuranosyltransferase domain-containing protein n=1 Tax=Conexibacter woesei TaxID=191495 RepID=UPI00040C997E|nr:alpha-(1->3)-arabinofuranosyltransferase family protein [Conexibacter woesei]